MATMAKNHKHRKITQKIYEKRISYLLNEYLHQYRPHFHSLVSRILCGWHKILLETAPVTDEYESTNLVNISTKMVICRFMKIAKP